MTIQQHENMQHQLYYVFIVNIFLKFDMVLSETDTQACDIYWPPTVNLYEKKGDKTAPAIAGERLVKVRQTRD